VFSAAVPRVSAENENATRIQTYVENLFYRQYRGEPVLLPGGKDTRRQ
jgi:hypothetical protein